MDEIPFLPNDAIDTIADMVRRKRLLVRLGDGGKLTGKDSPDVEAIVQAALLAGYTPEEADWQTITTSAFKAFHEGFQSGLAKGAAKLTAGDTATPWKGIGDELVYSFRISSKRQCHDVVALFLSTLRALDKMYKAKGALRLKGTAWIASFPLRNRRVELPMPQTYVKDARGKPVAYPYPRFDFLGPDMDIGFRISKFTSPGVLVVSADLAELLLQSATEKRLALTLVGFETLKGVWGEAPYPIVWACPPGAADYDPFSIPEEMSSKHVSELRREKSAKEVEELGGKLARLRAELPRAYGVVAPYVPGEDPTPPEHRRLRKALEELSRDPLAVDAGGLPGRLPSRGGQAVRDLIASIERLLDAATVRSASNRRSTRGRG